jgi:hypothetical protein
MESYHPVSHFLITYPAGNYYVTTVHPYPHIPSRHEEGITVVAILAAELAVDTDTLAHRDPAGERNVPVAPFRVLTERLLCLCKQDADPFLCHHLCCGIL